MIGESIKEVDTVLTATEVFDIINQSEEEGGILKDEKFEDLYKNQTNQQSLSIVQDSLFFENCLLLKSQAPINEESKENKKIENLEHRLKTNAFDKNSSHSYLETMIRGTIRDVYKISDDTIQLQYKSGKNQDIEECIVSVDEKEVFSMARIYGLRNIQTLTRNIKKGICKYKYVEVMACPSGCLNGGKYLRNL